MKNFATYLLLLMLVVVLVIGCFGCIGNSSADITFTKTKTIINGEEMFVYVIDSCEYVGFVRGSNADVLAHKGNCKYCELRRIQHAQSLINAFQLYNSIKQK